MQEIISEIEKVVKNLFGIEELVELSRTNEQFGDYASNVALRLSKKLGKNPRELAQSIAENIQSDLIEKTVVAGPGFINIFLTDKALGKFLGEVEFSNRFTDKTIVIETNNPNPFKAMHIGHAFNAILGDTTANLLDTTGAKVIRVSYHGDVGQHVGRSMYSILKFIDGDSSKLDQIKINERNSFMSKMYTSGSRAYKEDDEAKSEIDELASASFTLEDSLFKQVYETCMQWSFTEIDSIVKRLGNKPIKKRYLESQADEIGVKTVKLHTPGVFTETDGAYLFPGEKYGIFDNIFVSSKGRGLYGARDLGLMQLKNNDFHPDKSYIVTAEEQKDYFRGVIKAAELCLPELRDVTVSISTGTVKLSTGKMSSRTGEVVEIGWLFDTISKAIVERGGEPSDNIIAGALRYQFLKVKIGSDVVFNIEESVSLHGNSGPYLQYAHARACSILNKKEFTQGDSLLQSSSLEVDERSLLRKLGEYSEVVERSADELMPHYVCTYLYELAQNFNRFYEKNRVIDNEREELRLQLVAAYSDTLRSGLELLGIHAPNKM